MTSAGEAESEEYLDDPIKIIHCEQSRIKYINEQSKGIKIYHSNREQFRLNFILRRPQENSSINAEDVNTAYRFVKSVKLVDCGKFPWYFRKYTQQIINKINRLQNNICCDTEISVMEEISDDDCIILEPAKMDLTYQNVYKFGNKIVSEDIEIRRALSRKERNKNCIDFKRMIGLVGLKVTPKIEVIRDTVTCPKQNDRLRKQNEDTTLLDTADKTLRKFRKRKNNVNSKTSIDKQSKMNKDFKQDFKQPDTILKNNVISQQKEEKQEDKNLDIHAIKRNKSTDEHLRNNTDFEQERKLSKQSSTLQRKNVILQKLEEKEEIKNALENNSSEPLINPIKQTVIQITNEHSSPILPCKSFIKKQNHVDNLKYNSSTKIQDVINKAIENACNKLNEQDSKTYQNDNNNENEIESKKLNYSYSAIEQKLTKQKKSRDKSDLNYYNLTYPNNSANTDSVNVNKMNSSANEANFKNSTNYTNINDFANLNNINNCSNYTEINNWANYTDVNNSTNICANSTNKNDFSNSTNKKHIVNSNNIKDSANSTNTTISANSTNMNNSTHYTNTNNSKKGSLQILSVDKINKNQDMYKNLTKPTKISQGYSSLRQYHIVPEYKQNLIPHSVTNQNSGNTHIHNNKPSVVLPSYKSQFGHLVSKTTSRPILQNINESANQMNTETLPKVPSINRTYNYDNNLNTSQPSYRAFEEFAPPNVNIQSPQDTYPRQSNINPYLSNHNLLPPQDWRWPYSTFSISQLLKAPPPPPSLPPPSQPQSLQPQFSQPQPDQLKSLLPSSSLAHSTTLNQCLQILQNATNATDNRCAVFNSYNDNTLHNSAHQIKTNFDNKNYPTQNSNRVDNNLNADKRIDSEMPLDFSFLETVVTKSKMLEELDKITIEEHFDSNNIKRPRDLIVQPKESVPRQNVIFKTEPLPKRVKMGDETDVFMRKNHKNIASSIGYSPPILPIPPQYENILENLKSEPKNDNIKHTNAVVMANSSSGDICKKNPFPRLQYESDNCKKISIDEYKKRTFKTCNEKNSSLSNTTCNEKCEYKRNNDRNHSVESGYDSDTTVVISPIQL